MKTYKASAVQLIRERCAETIASRSSWYEEARAILRKEETIYIWGTGLLGEWVPLFLRGIGARGYLVYVDNDSSKWGTVFAGFPCVSPAQIPISENPLVIIGTGAASRPVAEQLGRMGVERVMDISDFRMNELFEDLRHRSADDIAKDVGRCFDILEDEKSREVLFRRMQGFFDFQPGFGYQVYYEDICQGDQYFQDDIIRFTEDSVIVDCGAYTGDTLTDFLRRGYPFKKYIAYELSRRNYEKLQDTIENVRGGGTNILACNRGVGADNAQIFYSDALTGAEVSEDGEAGEIVRMSDDLRDESVTFIKMDIEGAEMAALRGASELIRRCRPDLAICTYHSISDLWEIPLYMHALVPEYRLYVRHHTPVHYETVCYAVM